MDIFIGVLVFYVCGYALMHELDGGVIGKGKFLGLGFKSEDYLNFLFDFSFCATASTIVSGSLAERIHVDTYIIYSMIMQGIIYPFIAGWAWGGGWL